jgi:hypothetical protein
MGKKSNNKINKSRKSNDAPFIFSEGSSTEPATARKLFIFLDNSNIWIEGQRAYSKLKRQSDEPDSRFRVEVGKLLELIVGNRQFQQGLLVG